MDCVSFTKNSVFLLLQIKCSGVFELKILDLENPLGRDSTGECCTTTEPVPPPGSPCPAPCPARLRACLKHYQAQVDTTSPCTFGDLVTPVLGSNSLKLAPNGHLISFPFDFTWPVSLEIEILRGDDERNSKNHAKPVFATLKLAQIH